jgi:hypothetical protein
LLARARSVLYVRFQYFCEVNICHGEKKVAESFAKLSPLTDTCKRALYKAVEKYRIGDSELGKSKIQKFCFSWMTHGLH